MPRTRGRRRPAIAVVLAFVVVVGLVAAALVWVNGYSRSDVLLSSGRAWLASNTRLVSLVDGPSEELIGHVEVAADEDVPLEVLQLGTSALVADGVEGTVTRVDGATYEVTSPVSFADGPLHFEAGGSATYVIDETQGSAALIDVETLRIRDEFALGGTPAPGGTTVGGDGTLWALDDRGNVSGFGADGSEVASAAAGSDLVTAAGRPVLVDRSNGRAGALDTSGAVGSWATCLELPPDTDVRLVGARRVPLVFAVLPGTGELRVADVETGDCRDPIGLDTTSPDLGEPIEAGGFVMVPDTAAGETVIVDPDTGEVVPVPVTEPGTDFELVAKDGLVFYNETSGERAGVLRLRGGEWTAGAGIQKFSSGGDDEVILAGADTSIAPQDLPEPPTPTARPTATRTAAPTTGAPGTTDGEATDSPTRTSHAPTTTSHAPTTTHEPTTTSATPTTTWTTPPSSTPPPTTAAPTTVEPPPPLPTPTAPASGFTLGPVPTDVLAPDCCPVVDGGP